MELLPLPTADKNEFLPKRFVLLFMIEYVRGLFLAFATVVKYLAVDVYGCIFLYYLVLDDVHDLRGLIVLEI